MTAKRHLHAIPLTLLLALPAWSQSAPDAGAALRRLDQERKPALPAAAPPLQVPAAATPSASGLRAAVSAFKFDGNTLLDEAQLRLAVQSYLDRPLSFVELQGAAQAVAKAYRDAGWMVRAYLPQQDFTATSGTVTIKIVEAVVGKILTEENGSPRVKAEQVAAMFSAHLQAGQAMRADALDHALLLADDLPGIAVTGSLRKGEKAGETDIALRISQQPLLSGDVGIDNTGARSTGATQLTASLMLASPFGLGDTVSAQLTHTEGSDYQRLGASLPVGHDGLRLGLNFSALSYRLVAPEFDALQAKGSASTLGLEASYPVIRSRQENLSLRAHLDHKGYDNQSNGATASNYQVNALKLGLNGNRFDAYLGGGVNSAALDLTLGNLDLGGSPNQATDASTTQSAGGFSKLNFQLSRLQSLSPHVVLYGELSGQWADKNLDSSEKFYLGGANGVRAYPSSEGGGAAGHIVKLELRWSPLASYTLSGFYDHGQITINSHNGFTGAAAPNTYNLDGAGISLDWRGDLIMGVRPHLNLTWAHRMGSNPNALSSGQDQDGSLNRDRIWLFANLQF